MAGDSELSMVQENIEEFISDDNRVVTCKWLSLMLNMNINAAKRALYTYMEQCREKKGKSAINVTYFVAGLGKSKTGELEHKCVVVPESELDTVRESLSVVTTCHLYSIQATRLKDYTALYQTDFDIIKQNLDQCSSHSSIKCSWVAQKALRLVVKTESCQKPDKNESTSVSPAMASNPTSSSAAKTTKKAEPKGSIASMFAAGGQKKGTDVAASAPTKASDQKTVSKNNNSSSKSAKPAHKKDGVMAFFNANGVGRKTSPVKNNKVAVKVEEKQKEVAKEVVKTKKTKESDSEPEAKRRRRIRTDLFDSSEEEDEEEEEEAAQLEEEVKRESEDEERVCALLLSGSDLEDDSGKDVPIKNDVAEKSPKKTLEDVGNRETTKDALNGGGRKRKRAKKSVMKHFQDEEGFLVTKKEVVWESESDHSEPEEMEVVVAAAEKEEPAKERSASLPLKQNNKTATATKKVEPKGKLASKKHSSPQKGKQTSLTSFFKKS